MLGAGTVLRTATIFFYLSNEGISLLENTTRLGLPVPAQLRDTLTALTKHDESTPLPADSDARPPEAQPTLPLPVPRETTNLK